MVSGHYLVDGKEIPMIAAAKDLAIMVDTSLKFHQHIANIVHKASRVAENILNSTVYGETSFRLPLFITHITINRIFIVVEYTLTW